MPELPEVETVRRALEPVMVGAQFERVTCNRPDLRFPLPENFSTRLKGILVEALERRGKYMLARLCSRETLIMHLGMSGRFTVIQGRPDRPGQFHHSQETNSAHDHVIFQMSCNDGKRGGKRGDNRLGARLVYNDPRRFGFIDLVKTDTLETCRHFAGMGPEPLGNGFSETVLVEKFRGRKTPVKQALLDQRIVAGLGNIYVCEALFRTGISPKRSAGRIGAERLGALVREIRSVLTEAIEAGGSSLRDFASSDGSPGYFQHDFQIYGREGEACRVCSAPVRRIVQGGRSTFYCAGCQK